MMFIHYFFMKTRPKYSLRYLPRVSKIAQQACAQSGGYLNS